MEHLIIKILRTSPVIILAFLIMQGCYYDNEECLYPDDGEPCDTTGVTYAGTVLPLLQERCISCHSGAQPSGNISLDSYESVREAALKPAGEPGSLYGAINWAPNNSNMPQGQAKLPECTILRVKTWIDAGAPNN